MKLFLQRGHGIVVVLILLLAGTGCNKSDSVKSLVKKSKKHEESGNYKLALEYVNGALSIDSNESVIFVLRGKLYGYLDKHSFSIRDFRKALNLDSKNTSAFFQMGITHSLLHNDDSAIWYYEQALSTKMKGDFYFQLNEDTEEWGGEIKDVPIEAIRYERGISNYLLDRDSLAYADFIYSLKRNYEVPLSNQYIGLILIGWKNPTGCSYLRKAMEAGEKDAEKFLNEYCK